MPFTETEPSLPFSGKNRISRHTSYCAARDAAPARETKSARYLEWLRAAEAGTDWQAADFFGWPLSSVTSIRNGLVDRSLVEVGGITEGRYGKRVTQWRAVRVLREADAG